MGDSLWLLVPLLLLGEAARCLAAPPPGSERALAPDAIADPPPATEDLERRPAKVKGDRERKLHEEIESALGQMHADPWVRAYIGWMSKTIDMHRCIARYEEWAGMEELVGTHGRPPVRMIEVGTNFPERPDNIFDAHDKLTSKKYAKEKCLALKMRAIDRVQEACTPVMASEWAAKIPSFMSAVLGGHHTMVMVQLECTFSNEQDMDWLPHFWLERRLDDARHKYIYGQILELRAQAVTQKWTKQQLAEKEAAAKKAWSTHLFSQDTMPLAPATPLGEKTNAMLTLEYSGIAPERAIGVKHQKGVFKVRRALPVLVPRRP